MSFPNMFGGGYMDMGGGGGGGGGFMTDDSPSKLDSSQTKKSMKSMRETLWPVTNAMLHKAQYDNISEMFKFDDIELHQVTIVGVIREVQESSTNILYKVDDMTADSIIVRKWIEPDENPAEAIRRSQYRENSYVRVYGHMKSLQDKKCLVAFKIAPVKDFNEITYHMLDVIHSFLYKTKVVDKGDVNMSGVFNTGTETAGLDGKKVFSAPNTHGMSVIERQILDMVYVCRDEQGVSIDAMKQQLRGISNAQLKETLDFLSNEGHIYSTIDEEHFLSTSAGM
ncbi:replication protein A 32 kDa subunit-like [Rhopilema esculentum]|uniref:replication protein A 32 kDa subunit-like n=1 Tax=Rhopilema esculentum TaxID=499914 RepID=UPI0031D6D7E2